MRKRTLKDHFKGSAAIRLAHPDDELTPFAKQKVGEIPTLFNIVADAKCDGIVFKGGIKRDSLQEIIDGNEEIDKENNESVHEEVSQTQNNNLEEESKSISNTFFEDVNNYFDTYCNPSNRGNFMAALGLLETIQVSLDKRLMRHSIDTWKSNTQRTNEDGRSEVKAVNIMDEIDAVNSTDEQHSNNIANEDKNSEVIGKENSQSEENQYAYQNVNENVNQNVENDVDEYTHNYEVIEEESNKGETIVVKKHKVLKSSNPEQLSQNMKDISQQGIIEEENEDEDEIQSKLEF
jgi:hypothetical protein